MDSNLLKEAIADAKAVRATALANAKVALEEAFAPRFQAMFSEKLKEEAESPDTQSQDSQVGDSDIDSLIKELESEVGGEEDVSQSPDSSVPPTPETNPVDSDVPPTPSPVGAPIPAGVPVIIQPVDQSAAGNQVPPAPEGGPEGSPEGGTGEFPEGSSDEEDVDLNELLESLKSEEEDEEEECIKESVPVKSSGIAGSDNKSPSADASASSHVESSGKNNQSGKVGYPDAKVVVKDPADIPSGSKNMGDVTPEKMDTPKLTKETIETGVPGGKVTSKDPADIPSGSKNMGDVTPEKMDTPSLTKENASLKKQLGEATKTIVYIKEQLNEINLLNAKLLYTNKLFKEFTMDNTQKMRVVEMFDLSKNVREVKLTYATIAESLNFGGDTRKKPVVSASVQSITEGIASKPVGSTKPSKQIITEQSAMVSKFQKLAGIKKK